MNLANRSARGSKISKGKPVNKPTTKMVTQKIKGNICFIVLDFQA